MSDWAELTEALLGAARQAGAQDAEVLLSTEERHIWQTSGGRSRAMPDMQDRETADAQASLRVLLPGGRAAQQAIAVDGGGADALAGRFAALAAQTVAAARQAPEDPYAAPPDRYDLRVRGLSIDDPRHDRLEPEDREEILSWHWSAARGTGSRIRPHHFIITESRLVRAYGSTRGAPVVEPSTLYRVDGEISAVNRGDERVISGQVLSRHFADIASRPLGAELARRLEAGERATRMPAESLPLVLEAPVMAELLARLPPAFDAARVSRGESFLGEKLGQRVAAPWLHLIDDASVDGGLHTRAFDDRGIPPIPVPLLREGCLTGLYLDPEQARRRDTRPTGHTRADGGLWPGNLLLRPGPRTRNMVLADLERHLTAVDLIVPPTLDPATGRLDLQVWLVLDGSDRSPGKLGAWQIQTDLLSFLGAIRHLASDETRYDSVVSCTTVVEGLPLTEL